MPFHHTRIVQKLCIVALPDGATLFDHHMPVGKSGQRGQVLVHDQDRLGAGSLDLVGHRALKTLPSFYPLSLVDHIFVGSGLQTTKIEVPRTALEKIASDHLPLIVDVQVEGHFPDSDFRDCPDVKKATLGL